MSGAWASRRHRILSAITLGAGVVVLVVMLVWGIHAATRPTGAGPAKAARPCRPSEISVAKWAVPSDTTVSVYNAGARGGFAALTMQRLQSLGFHPGEVSNAPGGARVARAKVLTTKAADPYARLVARSLGRHTPVEVTDNQLGPGVDVYVGRGLHHLAAHPPKRVRLPKPVRTCVRVNGS